MCGIAGIIALNGDNCRVLEGSVSKMCSTIEHRGPDDVGLKTFPGTGKDNPSVVLGHRRLSIIDVSKTGHQPMSNEDGSIWICYNGEIYNYQELRSELMEKGHIFISSSDTEVIIHGYEEWGEDCLQKLRGMFAFTIWDQNKKQLFAARDRFGIKPFYYFYDGKTFVFASEIKAVTAAGMIKKEIDEGAASLYLTYGSIPSPKTIYKNIFSLKPGHWLTLDKNNTAIRQYYDIEESFLDTSLAHISDHEAVEMVHDGLMDTIKCHLVSDVPVGAFLSGGIDSTAVVSLMRQASQDSIKTISVVFPGTPYDESKYARIAAQAFETEHVEVEVTEKDMMGQIDNIIDAMDQPTVDGVNSYFVSWATANAGLKVAMSGVGGDEIFWGYNSFSKIPRLQRLMSATKMFPGGAFIGRSILDSRNTYRASKLSSMLDGGVSIPEIYAAYKGLFTRKQLYGLVDKGVGARVLGEVDPMPYLTKDSRVVNSASKVALLETTSYMSNQLLRDIDMLGMCHSLETRVPFVDHKLVELLAKIPVRYKLGKNMPKRLLVRAMKDTLPREIVYRKKMGFTFPIDLWMKKNLKNVIEDKIRHSRFFDDAGVEELLRNYSAGKAHWQQVWGCFVLGHWID